MHNLYEFFSNVWNWDMDDKLIDAVKRKLSGMSIERRLRLRAASLKLIEMIDASGR